MAAFLASDRVPWAAGAKIRNTDAYPVLAELILGPSSSLIIKVLFSDAGIDWQALPSAEKNFVCRYMYDTMSLNFHNKARRCSRLCLTLTA